MTPNAQYIKEQIDKLDFVEIKNICSSRHTAKNVKRQVTDCMKTLQSIYLLKDLCLGYVKNA